MTGGSISFHRPATLWPSLPGSTIAGTGLTSGIYAGTNPPAKDGIFNNANNTGIGVQITGLAAGVYNVFIHNRNTNASGTIYSQISSASAGSAGNFDFASYSAQTLSFDKAGATGAWVAEGSAGENYTKFEVTLTGMEPAINIALTGGSGESRPFLNTIQIVQVPEPSAALLGGLGALFMLRRRR